MLRSSTRHHDVKARRDIHRFREDLLNLLALTNATSALDRSTFSCDVFVLPGSVCPAHEFLDSPLIAFSPHPLNSGQGCYSCICAYQAERSERNRGAVGQHGLYDTGCRKRAASLRFRRPLKGLSVCGGSAAAVGHGAQHCAFSCAYRWHHAAKLNMQRGPWLVALWH
jgi:hypothetical protein